jgi:hypothetical protein
MLLGVAQGPGFLLQSFSRRFGSAQRPPKRISAAIPHAGILVIFIRLFYLVTFAALELTFCLDTKS